MQEKDSEEGEGKRSRGGIQGVLFLFTVLENKNGTLYNFILLGVGGVVVVVGGGGGGKRGVINRIMVKKLACLGCKSPTTHPQRLTSQSPPRASSGLYGSAA